MTPEIKILRDGLEVISTFSHRPTNGMGSGSLELTTEAKIAVDILKQADKVREDFSVDMSGAKVDSEKGIISGIKIRWST